MVDERKYLPRLSIEISQSQYNSLSRLIPWGVKNELFKLLVDDVIDLVEANGPIVIAAILSRKLHVRDFVSMSEILKVDPLKKKGGKKK